MSRIVFVTGTGTGVGKTCFTCNLLRVLREEHDAVGLKPIETGVVEGAPLDALALDEAGGFTYAHHPSFYRAAPPLAPQAVVMGGGAPPDIDRIEAGIHAIAADHEMVLVEGAGGPLVPLTAELDMLDLAARLHPELLLVVPNRLGCLSDARAAALAVADRGLRLTAVFLNRFPESDESQATNRAVLQSWLRAPVLEDVAAIAALLQPHQAPFSSPCAMPDLDD